MTAKFGLNGSAWLKMYILPGQDTKATPTYWELITLRWKHQVSLIKNALNCWIVSEGSFYRSTIWAYTMYSSWTEGILHVMVHRGMKSARSNICIRMPTLTLMVWVILPQFDAQQLKQTGLVSQKHPEPLRYFKTTQDMELSLSAKIQPVEWLPFSKVSALTSREAWYWNPGPRRLLLPF